MSAEPWRYPGPLNTPTAETVGREVVHVEVGIANEDPSTEDDLTLRFEFGPWGLTIMTMVSDGQEVGMAGFSYETLFGMADEDPA
jgi:hypothetical protein